MRKPKPAPSNALTLRPSTGQEIALPEEMRASAKNYAVRSRSPRTLKEYARCWRQFQAWCDRHGRDSLPAGVDTIAAYASWMADGQDNARPLSISTIAQAIGAIKYVHRNAKHVVDFEHPDLQRVLKGIRRVISMQRSIKRVKALTDNDIRDMLDMLRPDVPREARDLALICLAFAGGRRRSEVVGLDYKEMGADGKARLEAGRSGGVLISEDRGLVIKLLSSKTNTEGKEEEYLISREHAGRVCTAVEGWIRLANIQPGTPVIRAIKKDFRHPASDQHPQSGYPGIIWCKANKKWQARNTKVKGRPTIGYATTVEAAYAKQCAVTGETPRAPYHGAILPTRPPDERRVSDIIQARMLQVLIKRASKGGKRHVREEDKAALRAEAKLYSGHSGRAGLVTSAYERGVPREDIKKATGHKSDTMISIYTRVSDLAKHSAMKGSAL